MTKLFNIDCMDYIYGCPTEYFDLAIVDPPYGINGNSHRNNKNRGRLAPSKDYHMALWDQPIPTGAYFNELFRVSKNQIICGGNYFDSLGTPQKSPRREEYAHFIANNPTGWIIWDKVNGATGFNDCELIWTSFNIETVVYKFMWNGMLQGKSMNEGHRVQPVKAKNEKRIHPTQKPVELYKWLLNQYAKPGDKLLDTHLGSGSSALAAELMGFDFVGCELDPQYFAAAQKRFKEQTAQIAAF